MPFFSENISNLTTNSLEELLRDATAENVRLEFKSDVPGPDETLKKLSGFANTFGGYLIVGASASSSDGRLLSYPGVEPQRNYRQTIIQRCYEGIWPPIEVFVSDGIPTPNAADKVCYVIYVPESWEAPHFITKRRGAWIRTDEFSQRFDTRLATFEDIQHLTNRRRLAVERYDHLYARALGRFETLAAREYMNHPRKTSGVIGATLFLCLCPQFPTRQLITDHQLITIMASERIPWRGVRFPSGKETITQQESVLALHPTAAFSLVEANVWGQLTYSCEIERLVGGDHPVAGIHLNAFIGHILVFLEHARRIYRKIGYNGSLLLRALLKRVRGKPFIYFPESNFPEAGPASRIDDEISIDISISAIRLTEQRDEVAGDLLKVLFFSLNWPEQGADASTIKNLLIGAADYNHWGQGS